MVSWRQGGEEKKKRERERKENKIKDRQWEILFLDVTAWAVQRRVCERLPDGQTDGACPGTPVASHIRLRAAYRKAFSVEPILTWAQRGVLLPKGDGGTKLSAHQRTVSEGTDLLWLPLIPDQGGRWEGAAMAPTSGDLQERIGS